MYSVTALPFSRCFINSSQAFYINTYIILHESPKCQNTIVTLFLHLPHEVQGFVESHGSKKASLFRVPSRVRVVGPACRRCQIGCVSQPTPYVDISGEWVRLAVSGLNPTAIPGVAHANIRSRILNPTLIRVLRTYDISPAATSGI